MAELGIQYAHNFLSHREPQKFLIQIPVCSFRRKRSWIIYCWLIWLVWYKRKILFQLIIHDRCKSLRGWRSTDRMFKKICSPRVRTILKKLYHSLDIFVVWNGAFKPNSTPTVSTAITLSQRGRSGAWISAEKTLFMAENTVHSLLSSSKFFQTNRAKTW